MTRDQTRLSFAHGDPSLRADNPLYQRAGSARQAFEKVRCPGHAAELSDRGSSESQRREEADRAARKAAFLAKRQKPKPELRPSLSLALGADRAAFNSDWHAEWLAARPRSRGRGHSR